MEHPTMTSFSPALIAEMRSWLADLTFVDLTSDDVLDASLVSDADVIDVVDRLYAGGTAAFVLTSELAAAAASSDGQLLTELGLVLRGCAEPVLRPRLSTLVAHVCHAYLPEAIADERAERLILTLADYLHGRHVLRETQVSPSGLDEWAAGTPMTFLQVAMAGCARSQDVSRTDSGVDA
jgi:hypothetical protein